MLDTKMIVNVAIGIIVAMVVLKVGGALLYKSGVGPDKARMHDKQMKADAAEDGDGAE